MFKTTNSNVSAVASRIADLRGTGSQPVSSVSQPQTTTETKPTEAQVSSLDDFLNTLTTATPEKEKTSIETNNFLDALANGNGTD